jgi:hypothetical protein
MIHPVQGPWLWMHVASIDTPGRAQIWGVAPLVLSLLWLRGAGLSGSAGGLRGLSRYDDEPRSGVIQPGEPAKEGRNAGPNRGRV